ncbi:CRISPR-associated protein Cas5/CasD, subtype I-E/ECOLI [Pannonibacter phragmitetus]|uniref:CRISPR-associated protein Cas5/CasD, subtype I-E/ECOLI n=1 Tax=Pannonibacter phragmitetus TaxID=121719 RepID=A0A378ZXJ8_9HYPH|nr:type I-E CRISPR-associated protein Cas5/CasD [Pannonibacter phragmitetus]SUB01569.1 CRISPR-associated protein Cas5/CasD, subtype I-E/ECOLI [Pannonibacter phragmitetus]
MTQSWLVITLEAPLASFGEAAGNAQRGTAERPSRSALLGLAGAALGLRREDAAGQARLFAGLRTASLSQRSGKLLTDFHTFQSLPSSAGAPRSRAAALALREELSTSITRREYRMDVRYLAGFTAADGVAEGQDIDLAALAEAFRRPRFALWLGRKSCPLSRPLNPLVVPSPDAAGAFLAYLEADPALLATVPREAELAVETLGDLPSGARISRQHTRRDDPQSRSSWQFASRSEYVTGLSLPARPEREAAR